MAIDSSIYRNMASQTPDIMGAVDQGLRMKDLIQGRKEKSAIKDAYKKSTSIGPDGEVKTDRGMLMKDLFAASPEAAAQEQEKFKLQESQNSENQFKKLGMIANLAGSAVDQPSWTQARAEAIKMGLAREQDLPEMYDPKFVENRRGMALTQMQRLEQANKEREFQLREKESMRKAGGDPLAEELKYQRLGQMRREAQEAEFKKTPQGRLQALNSGDKGRLDNVKVALESVQGMAGALLGDKENTFSLIGDNNFTRNSNLFEEVLGRMQSGGAITDGEKRNFAKLRPTATDSPKMQRDKLVELQRIMSGRLQTLGFTPEDLGISLADLKTMGVADPQGTAGVEKANAGSAQIFKTNQIDWAD